MGNTYETDGIEKRNEIALVIQAAIIMKTLGNLVACRSWLVARLSLKELRQRVDELAETIEAEGK